MRRIVLWVDIVSFLLILGASARLTRLATDDKIIAAPRNWIIRNAPSSIAYLVVCPWCIGLWISIAVTVGWWFAPRTPAVWVATALTVNLLWAVAQEILDRITQTPDDDDGEDVDAGTEVHYATFTRRPNPDWSK